MRKEGEDRISRWEIHPLEERIAPVTLTAGDSGLTLEGSVDTGSVSGSISGTTPGGQEVDLSGSAGAP